MFNWNRILADLCWSMVIADPNCYCYCLAHRIDIVNRNEQRLVSAPRAYQRPRKTGSPRLRSWVAPPLWLRGLGVRVRRMTIATAGALLLLSLVLLVHLTLAGLPRTTHPSRLITPTIVTSPEELHALEEGQQ